jgi:hypothetical protein
LRLQTAVVQAFYNFHVWQNVTLPSCHDRLSTVSDFIFTYLTKSVNPCF